MGDLRKILSLRTEAPLYCHQVTPFHFHEKQMMQWDYDSCLFLNKVWKAASKMAPKGLLLVLTFLFNPLFLNLLPGSSK